MRMLLLILLLSPYLSFADFKMEDVPLKRAISTIYEEVLEKPYMLDPNILNSDYKVSFYLTDNVDKKAFFKRYFENMNIIVYEKDGVDYLKYKNKVVKGVEYVYKPKFRSVEFLSKNLEGIIYNNNDLYNLDSKINTTSTSINSSNAAVKNSINTNGDLLVIYADKDTIQKAKNVLKKIDVKPQQVIITARILEVKKQENSQSGLRIISEVLKNKLSLNLTVGSLSNSFFKLSTKDVNGFFSIFDTDSKFNVISSPVLRVLDNERGTFTVGSDVPTLGGEIIQNGVVRREIEYRSSGVIFDVSPTIMQDGIKVKIVSELSDFKVTETGVNDTPTLIKRLVDTTVYLKSGDLVVLGGLSEEKNTRIDDSFFYLPSWLFGRSKKFEKSDVLLLLHVHQITDDMPSVDLDGALNRYQIDKLF
ncbi:type II secretion system protein GspD [Haemophilus haemoglobinophilus]|nr:type II secretion system protein GspD [Canicola haemoglobinophilus]MBN6711826.1 type II secretion system protein GspD [Canicola haemoglobinophilus]